MAVGVLVDSNYYIHCQRLGLDPFDELAGFADTHDFVTCGMVVMEVLRGVRHPPTRERYRTGFAVMVCVPTTSHIWELATEIAFTLDRKGTPIPPQDSLIAAHALHAEAAVLTFDPDFRRVPGLTVLDQLS